ncbi:MAG: alpha/beta fold hydrolase [Sporichthyaceae bacterium]
MTGDQVQVTDAYTGGTGTPLALFHGLNGSWRIWRPVLAGLEAEHAVFAPTMIGHRGGPALAPGPNGIAVLADDMERRFDAAGIGTAHLVGNSLGGWLACELAARGRATSVVAFAPAGSWTNPRDLRRVARLMKLARSSAGKPSVERLMAKPKVRRALLRSAMERGDLVSGADLEGMSADLAACTALDGLLASLAVTGPLREQKIAKDCPVLVAWPAKDRTIPYGRYGAPFVAGIPHAEFVQLSGVGHVPMYDNPALVVRTVLDHTRKSEER